MRVSVLVPHGTRGMPFAIYEARWQSAPYPDGGFTGFRHMNTSPLIVLADSGTVPGYIFRYDYHHDRIRVYQFNTASDTAFEIPVGSPFTNTVRFLAIYQFTGS